MEKQQRDYYDDLHTKLADKFDLLPNDVSVIHFYSIHLNKSRKDIAILCAKKLLNPMGEERKGRNRRIMNFVASCSQDDFIEITK